MTQSDLEKYGMQIYKVGNDYVLYEGGGYGMVGGTRSISPQDVSGLDPSSIKSVDTLGNLPMANTSKANLGAGGLQNLLNQYKQNELAWTPANAQPVQPSPAPTPVAPNDLPRVRNPLTGQLEYASPAEADLIRRSNDPTYAREVGMASDIQGFLSRGGTKAEGLQRYGIDSATYDRLLDEVRAKIQYKIPGIADAVNVPNSPANPNFINALFKESSGRDATKAELAKFGAMTAKDAANIILREKSPFILRNQTPPISSPSTRVPTGTNAIPSLQQPSADTIQSNYLQTGIQTVDSNRKMLEDAYNRQITDLQKRMDDSQKQIDAMTAKQEGILGQTAPLTDPFRQKLEDAERERLYIQKNFDDNQKLVNELEMLLTQGNDLIAQQKNATGLGSIKNPRVANTMEAVNARAGVLQAVMAARNGQIAQAYTMIDRSVEAITADRQDKLNYYKTLYDFYGGIKGEAKTTLGTLTTTQRKYLDAQIGQLENDLKITQDNAERIKKAMEDPDTAMAYGQAGVTLNDTPEVVAQKLSKWGYSQEVSKTSNDMAQKGYTALVAGNPPAGAEVVSVVDSKGVTKRWYKAAKETAITQDWEVVDWNGKKVLFNKKTGELKSGTGDNTTGPTPQEISDATALVTLGLDLLKNEAGMNQAIGPIKGTLPTYKNEGANFVAKLNAFVGQSALKNMGRIKGVLSDSDMALLKSASTGGLSRVMEPAEFKKTLQQLVGMSMAVQYAPVLQQELSPNEVAWLDDGETIYAYKNNDGTFHVGFKDDGYQDITVQKQSFNSVGNDTDKVAEAIGQFESGGDYKALGPVTQNGDRAYGKYQVMGNNIPSWTKTALGKSMTPQQFLNDKEAQDKVARYYMGMHLAKYGNIGDVASIWFSGKPMSQAGNAKDVLGTSVPTYIKNIQSIYNSLG